MRSRWFAPVCILAMLVFSAAVYSRLPDQVPSHWNIQGQMDGTMSRLGAALFLPAMSAGVWLLLLVLPRIDPRRASYSAFQGTFRLFINALALFFALVHVAQLGIALGWDIGMPRVIMIGAGLLFAVLGNELGRVQPNWFVGIRTPWTLADPEVWRRTHRVGGRLFVVAGLLTIVAGALLPLSFALYVMLAAILGVAGGLCVYSYVLWRRGAVSG